MTPTAPPSGSQPFACPHCAAPDLIAIGSTDEAVARAVAAGHECAGGGGK